jgi:hypothetical protein
MDSPEHAVIVTYTLSGDSFGESQERDSVRALEKRLTTAIESAGVGELDGNEFGGGNAVLYAYGPDASRLFAVMEADLRAFSARPAHAVLRYGDATDPAATEQRIDL